jgi:quercetin dioxygenase-like cupin family protein
MRRDMSALWTRELRIPFTEIEWTDDVPGIRACETEVDGRRWALVEYADGARRHEWCLDGHIGFVLEGGVEYEFEDQGEPLKVTEGEAFSLSTGRAHRGRNLADGLTRLFLIDDAHVA